MSLYALALLIIILHITIAVILFPAIKILSLFLKRFYAELSWLWLTAIVLTFCVPAYAVILEVSSIFIPQVEHSMQLMETAEPLETAVDQSLDPTPAIVTAIWKLVQAVLPGAIILWSLGVVWLLVKLFISIAAEKKIQAGAQVTYNFSSMTKRTIKTSDETESPMVIGLFNPVILIPNNLSTIDQHALSAIIQHEEAHIERKDILWSAIQTYISILFWWNPLLRMMNTELNFNRELACDQRVMNKGANPQKYAKTLIECAQQLTQNHTQLNQQFLVKRKLFSTRINEVMTMRKVKSNKYLSVFLCGILCTSAFAVAEMADAGKSISALPNNQEVKSDPLYIPYLIQQLDRIAIQNGVENLKILLVEPKTTVEGSIEDSNRGRELIKQYMIRLNQNHEGMEVLLNLLQKNDDGSSHFVLTLPTDKATDAFHSTLLGEGLKIDKIRSAPKHISFEGTASSRPKVVALMRQLEEISPKVRLSLIRPNDESEGENFKLTIEPPTTRLR